MATTDAPKTDLTPRQQAFVCEYLVDRNGTQAAIRAGYAPGSADRTAYRLLRDARIKVVVEAATPDLSNVIAEYAEEVGVTAEVVLQELIAIGLSNIADYLKINEDGSFQINLERATREQLSAVSEITVKTTGLKGQPDVEVTETKFKLHPKLPALEKLAYYTRLIIDKAGEGGGGGTHNHLYLNTPEAVEAFKNQMRRDLDVLDMIEDAV